MACDSVGGWIVDGILFMEASIANGLWYFEGKNPEGKIAPLLFFGWFEADSGVKMYMLDILFLSFKFAYVRKKIRDKLQ
jgi:hypothetical protein